MASLQLLRTAGGNQAKLDARSEFEISQRSPNGGGEAGHATGCIHSFALNTGSGRFGVRARSSGGI